MKFECLSAKEAKDMSLATKKRLIEEYKEYKPNMVVSINNEIKRTIERDGGTSCVVGCHGFYSTCKDEIDKMVFDIVKQYENAGYKCEMSMESEGLDIYQPIVTLSWK